MTQDHAFLLLRRLWGVYLKSYRMRLLMAVVCMGCAALSTALLAHVVQPLFDDIFAGHDPARLWPLALLMLGIFALKGVAGYGQIVLLNGIGGRIVALLQEHLFQHIIEGDVAFFQKRASGRLMSLLTYDTQVLRNGLTSILLNMGRDTLTLIFLIGVMVYKDPFLASIALVGFPLVVVPIRTFGRKMRKISGGAQEAMERLNVFFQQSFQGIRLIKAYGMETYEKKRALERIRCFLKLSLKGVRVRALLHPLMETLGGVAIVSVVLYGGQQVMESARTTGSFISFMTALLLAYEPLKKLVHMNTELQEGLSALSRIFGVLDTHMAIRDEVAAVPLRVNRGEIVFENVCFAYPEKPLLFRDLSVVIGGGKRVAFVGPSGAGKSTLINLLLRFHDSASGQILIDGQPISRVTTASLREQIAYVGQDVTLFDETVLENIQYGRMSASFEEVAAAARYAAADGFIQQLPDGYNTRIGERGLQLSGGQRQRLAIARAMLKGAPILLLDEATSSLDTQSEWQVQQALDRLMEGRTTVTIAHRLSTVEKADHIFVLDKGAVVEQGQHVDLLAADGLYARLVVPQLNSVEELPEEKTGFSL